MSPTTIQFEEVKESLLAALKKKAKLGGEDFTLLNGFILQGIQQRLSGNFTIGGPAIPLVAVVGNNTGQVHFFALKALLPDLDLK